MRIRCWALLGFFLLSFTAFAPGIAAAANGNGYAVQPGDILTISVWKEKDLQGDVLVRPDGGLSFPLVGNLQAAGRTVPEIQKEISHRLVKYIPDPVVSVAVKQIVGNAVYVIGKVNKPGQFVMTSKIDVVQALSLAAGMTPYASVNNIKILRRENGKLTAIPFEYGDIEKGENLSQDIILKSGDVVVVP
ncbi:MAG: polysaccharide biosynthesis/export family protein [Gammaproteobacteria bacterium]